MGSRVWRLVAVISPLFPVFVVLTGVIGQGAKRWP